MRAEYYADEYRRYATYVRNYGDNKIYKEPAVPQLMIIIDRSNDEGSHT